jgi:hypothetical protein
MEIRERAVCMFYCEEFNDKNVARLLKRIEDPGELDICYENDPVKPVLVLRTRILAELYIYKRYESCNSDNYLDNVATRGGISTS